MQNLPVGAFTAQAANIINSNFGSLVPLLNNVYYVDPDGGNDANDGRSQSTAWYTFQKAYDACVPGNNDAVALVGNGGTSATVRLTTTFTWAKNATHLIGIASGVNISNRARFAPVSGGTAFANFFVVSASGCYFSNIQWFQGFSTGTTSQICMTVTGGRNLFENCHIAGMGDDASAQSAGSRSLKISGTGENQFAHCTIGVDTVTRTQANASVEFAGGTPRNVFESCYFPFQGSAAGVLGILGTGAACMDRFQLFQNCQFINNVKSTSTAMTALVSLTSASPGGLLLFGGNSAIVGITKWGDTNGLANSYVVQAAPTQATSGIAVNPS